MLLKTTSAIKEAAVHGNFVLLRYTGQELCLEQFRQSADHIATLIGSLPFTWPIVHLWALVSAPVFIFWWTFSCEKYSILAFYQGNAVTCCWQSQKMQNHPFKQLGLLEPWFVITHTIWTTQEDTVFISDRDRNGGRCSVCRSDVSRDSLIVSESQKEFTDDEGVPRNVWSTYWTSTTVPVSITNKNCVLLCRSNRVCFHESGF